MGTVVEVEPTVILPVPPVPDRQTNRDRETDTQRDRETKSETERQSDLQSAGKSDVGNIEDPNFDVIRNSVQSVS